jgi:ribonuclease HII
MKWLMGIDEAGRGPLAGPVAVGVFVILKNDSKKLKILKKVRDSKVLSHSQREAIYEEICRSPSQGLWRSAIGFSSSQYIDTHGIVPAIRNAMKKALNALNRKYKIRPEDCEVLLDGSLKAPPEYKNQKTIIKGDAKIPVISAASICAKVLRDRYMKKISTKSEYKNYSFEIHKGYGTKMHRERILQYSMCEEHRRSFLKNLVK